MLWCHWSTRHEDDYVWGRCGVVRRHWSIMVELMKMKSEEELSMKRYRSICYDSYEKERGKGKRQAFCSFNPQRSRMKYYSYVKGYVTVVEIGLGEPESIESSCLALVLSLFFLLCGGRLKTDEIFVSECNEVSVLHIQ